MELSFQAVSSTANEHIRLHERAGCGKLMSMGPQPDPEYRAWYRGHQSPPQTAARTDCPSAFTRNTPPPAAVAQYPLPTSSF